MSLHGKGKMVGGSDEDVTGAGQDTFANLYDAEDWQEVPASSRLTRTTEGESSEEGGNLEQPTISDQRATSTEVTIREPAPADEQGPISGLDRKLPSQPGVGFVGDLSGLKLEQFSFERESPRHQPIPAPILDRDVVSGAAAKIIDGQRGYVPAVHHADKRAEGADEVQQKISLGTDRKVARMKGMKQTATSQVRSKPMEPVQPVMKLPLQQQSQRATFGIPKPARKLLEQQLSQQEIQAEAMVVEETMGSTTEADEGKRLLSSVEAESDQHLDLYLNAITREAELKKRCVAVEEQLVAAHREGSRLVNELASARSRYLTAEEGNRMLWQEGNDKVAHFSKEFGLLKAELGGAHRRAEEQRIATEKRDAQTLQRYQSLISERDAYITSMDTQADEMRAAGKALEQKTARQEAELIEQQRQHSDENAELINQLSSTESVFEEKNAADRERLVKALQVQASQHENAQADGQSQLELLKRERDHAVEAVRQQFVKELQRQKQKADRELAAVQQQLDVTEKQLAESIEEVREGADAVTNVEIQLAFSEDEVRKHREEAARLRDVANASNQSIVTEGIQLKALNEKLVAEQSEHNRAMADVQHQLQHALAVARDQSNEYSALLAEAQKQTSAFADLEKQLAVCREEAAQWKDAANTKSTEPRSDTSGDEIVAADKLTLQSLTDRLETEKSAHDRAITDFQQQLDLALQSQKGQSKENSTLLEKIQEHAEAVAKVQSELAKSQEETLHWKQVAHAASSELRSQSSVSDKTVQELAGLKLETSELTLDRDAAIMEKNRLEKFVAELQEQAKAFDNDIKTRDELQSSLVRSQTAVAELQSQLEWQQRDQKLSSAAVLPTNPLPSNVLTEPLEKELVAVPIEYPSHPPEISPRSLDSVTDLPVGSSFDTVTVPSTDKRKADARKGLRSVRRKKPVHFNPLPAESRTETIPDFDLSPRSFSGADGDDPSWTRFLPRQPRPERDAKLWEKVLADLNSDDPPPPRLSSRPKTPYQSTTTPDAQGSGKPLDAISQEVPKIVYVPEVKEVLQIVYVPEVQVKKVTEIIYVPQSITWSASPFRCWVQVYIDLWALFILWLTIRFGRASVTSDTDNIVSSPVAGPQASSILSPSVVDPQASSVESPSVAGPQASSILPPSVAGPQASSLLSHSVVGPQASSVELSSVVEGSQASSSVLSPSVAGHQAASVVSDYPPAQEASSPAASSSVGGPQASSVVSSSDPGSQASSVVLPSNVGPQATNVVKPSGAGHQASSVVQDCSPDDDRPLVDSLNDDSPPLVESPPLDLLPVDPSHEALVLLKASLPSLRVNLCWLLIHFALYAFLILCCYNYWLVCRERAVWFAANDATRQLYQKYFSQPRQGLMGNHDGELAALSPLWFQLHRLMELSRLFPG